MSGHISDFKELFVSDSVVSPTPLIRVLFSNISANLELNSEKFLIELRGPYGIDSYKNLRPKSSRATTVHL